MPARPGLPVTVYSLLGVSTPAAELLRRLDDSAAEVRRSAAAALPALVSALGPACCGAQWRGRVEHWARTPLVYLDDAGEQLQELVLGELPRAGLARDGWALGGDGRRPVLVL